MTLPNLVTCFPITNQEIETIRASIEGNFQLIVSDQDRIAEDLLSADIFFGHAKVPVDWERVVGQGRLQWIQSSAAGLDHCLTPAVIESSILVSGCSALFAPQVAEQSMALLMGLIRSMPVFFKAQQQRDYTRRGTDNLEGKQVLIVGMGGNGHRIARTIAPLCGPIFGTDYFPEACEPICRENVVQQVLPPDQLDSLLPDADVVIITLPLSDSNEQLFDDQRFATMKTGAYLVNVGRGSVVRTDSLIAALESKRLAGAGIDVVDPEPLPETSPLWAMDQVIISPHVGAQSPRRVPVTVDLFCQNFPRFLAGQALLNQVDKPLGFPRPEFRISF